MQKEKRSHSELIIFFKLKKKIEIGPLITIFLKGLEENTMFFYLKWSQFFLKFLKVCLIFFFWVWTLWLIKRHKKCILRGNSWKKNFLEFFRSIFFLEFFLKIFFSLIFVKFQENFDEWKKKIFLMRKIRIWNKFKPFQSPTKNHKFREKKNGNFREQKLKKKFNSISNISFQKNLWTPKSLMETSWEKKNQEYELEFSRSSITFKQSQKFLYHVSRDAERLTLEFSIVK